MNKTPRPSAWAFIIPLLFFCASISAVQSKTILVVGDSLSAGYGMEMNEGWVNLLRQRLKQRGFDADVVNASISGETTSGALARLPDLLKRCQPEVVIVEVGGNDGLQGLSLAAMEENLRRIVQKARSMGSRVVLIGMKLPPNYGPAYTQSFEAVYQRLARRTGVAFVPFLLGGVAGNNQLMQPDGMHASVQAQPQLLDNVWSVLKPLLEGAKF